MDSEWIFLGQLAADQYSQISEILPLCWFFRVARADFREARAYFIEARAYSDIWEI